MSDAALTERWARLIEVREAVNREIELQRQAKTIGTSLAAKVRLWSAGDVAALLRPVRGRSADVVHRVRRGARRPGSAGGTRWVGARGGTGRSRSTSPARPGTRCERCWRYVARVSADPERPGICDRCLDALAEAVNSVACRGPR